MRAKKCRNVTIQDEIWQQMTDHAGGEGQVSAFIRRMFHYYKIGWVSWSGRTRHRLRNIADNYSAGDVELLINAMLNLAESDADKLKIEIIKERPEIEQSRKMMV